jgi:hypothetical protein
MIQLGKACVIPLRQLNKTIPGTMKHTTAPLATTDFTARYEAALFDFAAGSLPTGPAFVVAAHLALRPQANDLVNVFDAAGGALLDELEPVHMSRPNWLGEDSQSPANPPAANTTTEP